jgi:hypothetical protein
VLVPEAHVKARCSLLALLLGSAKAGLSLAQRVLDASNHWPFSQSHFEFGTAFCLTLLLYTTHMCLECLPAGVCHRSPSGPSPPHAEPFCPAGPLLSVAAFEKMTTKFRGKKYLISCRIVRTPTCRNEVSLGTWLTHEYGPFKVNAKHITATNQRKRKDRKKPAEVVQDSSSGTASAA